MPEENEKVEDFVSLWRKKMKSNMNKPSAIGETLEKIKDLESENEDLRIKIKDNVDLISKTEEIVKRTINENERLKEEINQGGIQQQQSIELNNKVQSLITNLTVKEEELKHSNNEINELRQQIENLSTTHEPAPNSISKTNSNINTALLDDFQSDLLIKKSKIAELEKKMLDIIEENENLKGEMKKLSIEEKVPAETPKTTVIKPIPSQTSTATLEILCQDLQSDLNKYKRIVEKLTKEKSDLQRNIEKGGIQLDLGELEDLKLENEELKNELSKIQDTLKQKAEEPSIVISTDELEEKIKGLQNQLKEKDNLIANLKATSQTPIAVQRGPMTGLIEDLQNKINKLKITLEEKNKIIEELKSS